MQGCGPRAEDPGVETSRQTGQLAALVLAGLVTIGALWRLNGDPARLGPGLSCPEAQLWAGALRCGEELFEDLGPACASEVSRSVEPGDAIGVAACACARAPALAGFGLSCPAIERMAPEQLAALGQRVEINTASAEELASLPGVGPTIAGRIIAGRPHARVDDLLGVRGIGPKRLADLRARAWVEAPPSP